MVVREGTEGPYTGNGGALRVGTPAEVATEVSVNTAYGVERVVRDAFARARRRPRRQLTLVHKTNVLVHAGSVWWRIFDAGRHRVPRGDHRLHAHRRRDDPHDRRPEPLRRDRHRQPLRRHHHRPGRRHHRWHRPGRLRQRQPRPDRARRCSSPCTAPRPTSPGQQKADPTAAILSTSLLLDHLGHAEAAAAVEAAVLADLAERTPGHHASYQRGRRRIAARVARLTRTVRVPGLASTSWTHQHDRQRPARRRRPAGRDPRQPRLRHVLHRPHVHRRVDARRGLARRPDHALRPADPRPRHRGPALRAGDLRGHEGLPPRRRLGLDLPARGERQADGALQPAARVPGARPRRLRRRGRRAGERRPALGAATPAGARRASTCGRSCSPPRCSSGSDPRST